MWFERKTSPNKRTLHVFRSWKTRDLFYKRNINVSLRSHHFYSSTLQTSSLQVCRNFDSSCSCAYIYETRLKTDHLFHRPKNSGEKDITCAPFLNSPKKPANLLAMEAESFKLRHEQYLVSCQYITNFQILQLVNRTQVFSQFCSRIKNKPWKRYWPCFQWINPMAR